MMFMDVIVVGVMPTPLSTGTSWLRYKTFAILPSFLHLRAFLRLISDYKKGNVDVDPPGKPLVNLTGHIRSPHSRLARNQ